MTFFTAYTQNDCFLRNEYNYANDLSMYVLINDLLTGMCTMEPHQQRTKTDSNDRRKAVILVARQL